MNFPTGQQLSRETVTGMLETESPAMESNGNAFVPDLPVLGQGTEWSMNQPLSENSDVAGQEQHVNSSELGSVEKAVEQCQLASAQLLQEAQPPPPPPPPPLPTDEPEPAAAPEGPQPEVPQPPDHGN